MRFACPDHHFTEERSRRLLPLGAALIVAGLAGLALTGTSLAAAPIIAAGQSHTLALKEDGSLWAWGADADGQLGDGQAGGTRATPGQVIGLQGVVIQALTGGDRHSLALDADGVVWAWGADDSGQLGDGEAGAGNATPTPVSGLEEVVIQTIAAGGRHSLALDTDGVVWAWGADDSGQLGDGEAGESNPTPTPVSGLEVVTVRELAGGGDHSLALDAGGVVWAWGADDAGQLGDGEAGGSNATPLPVTGLEEMVMQAIAGGGSHSLALDAEGAVWAWGADEVGQLGDGEAGAGSPAPLPVTGLGGVVIQALAAGGTHSLALDAGGFVWAWGADDAGQLGDGESGGSRAIPEMVLGLDGVTIGGFAAGGSHSTTLDTSGPVWSWGDNGSGQLGDPEVNDSPSPVQVVGEDGEGFFDTGSPSSGFVQFAADEFTVREDGVLATITVLRTGETGGTLTVDYATADGSATAGEDYVATTGQLSFATGETESSFPVVISDDVEVEGDETIELTLANPSLGALLGEPATAVLTIVDQEAGSLEFSTESFTVKEDQPAAMITVVRTGGDVGEVSVEYTTTPGSATEETDYLPVSGTLLFPDGVVEQNFEVPVLDDAEVEGDEAVQLTLGNPGQGGSLGQQSGAVLTITDREPGLLQFGSAAFEVKEDVEVAVVTVERIDGNAGEVTVDYASADVTATADLDYTSVSGTLLFADEESEQTFEVPILDDTEVEEDEILALTLVNATAEAALGDLTEVELTILDREPGSLQFAGTSFEVEEVDGVALITVVRTDGDAGEVTVDYSTGDGTAVAGVDYEPVAGTLTLADEATEASFQVPVLENEGSEEDHTVAVSLENAGGGADLGSPLTAGLVISNFLPGTLQLSSDRYVGQEKDGEIALIITRTGGREGVVTVDINAVDGSAVAGEDYDELLETVEFVPGQGESTVFLAVTDNDDDDGNKSLTATLSNPTGGAALGIPISATVDIEDDEQSSDPGFFWGCFIDALHR